MLELSAVAPLSNCTYLGVDSGSHPIGFSLFMDVLAALGR
jgi:hypothetical protein